MPYIKPELRAELLWGDARPETPGELNFVITQELVEYLDRMGAGYQTINDILGALEGAKLEFYARVARPFEHAKMVVNGDVY